MIWDMCLLYNINTLSSGGLRNRSALTPLNTDVMVFNGSEDSATNDDHGFGTAVRLTNESYNQECSTWSVL